MIMLLLLLQYTCNSLNLHILVLCVGNVDPAHCFYPITVVSLKHIKELAVQKGSSSFGTLSAYITVVCYVSILFFISIMRFS